MRKIAIVGSGQAGLQLAFGLLQHGYAVTLYSDRTPEAILEGRVPATAFIFDRGLSYERELGLNFWDDEVKWGEGIHLDFCLAPGNRFFSMAGRFRRPGQAIDQRLKYWRWMRELETRGGTLVIQPIGVSDLDALAAESDLLVIAAGKAEVSALFERDPDRSVYDRPQRNLALVTVKGLKPWPSIPFHPVKFTFFEQDGEIFWVTFHHKSSQLTYSLLFESKPGRGLDRFGPAETGEDMLAVARDLISRWAPWEAEHIRSAELADPLAWGKGAITPTVRKPVARLPSGRLAFGIGDTVILNDPIGGQGSNCASKAAHLYTQRIVEHGDRPFDADWMQAVFDEHWEKDGRWITAFSNVLLEPVLPAAKEVLLAGTRHGGIAAEFFDDFNNPQDFWPRIEDVKAARRYIAERTGAPWLKTAALARAAIAAGQVRRKLGKPLFRGA
jgi:2-polyprenyl-6-methoxyphenol hydroxylase-like FAD-dependent oxidoreductase